MEELILDTDDLALYINKKTGFDVEIIEEILNCETEYMKKKGIAEVE
ncbi:hypothetical protein LZ906_017355 (plasmid) [Paraclostridium ghonii]|nr:hypothetical protein [Paeniclostridium ghonii]MCM0167621.1 hypothetical protein [Paeniclostridium ghonii]